MSTVLLIFVAWCVVAFVVGVCAGRFIAFGQRDLEVPLDHERVGLRPSQAPPPQGRGRPHGPERTRESPEPVRPLLPGER